MKIYEIGTGYTPIPAKIGAATEIVVEELTRAFKAENIPVEIIDIGTHNRPETDLLISEVPVLKCFTRTDLHLGILHKAKRIVYSIALAKKLAKIAHTSSSRIVFHFHNQYNLFFFLKMTPRTLREKCIIAYTNHSGIWRQPWEKIKSTIRKRYFQEAECMKRADIVFALNDETIDNAVTHLNIPRNHFVRIDNGVNTDVYYPLSESEKKQAKLHLGLEDKRIILQVGSVYENKGQARSLELLAPYMQQNTDLVYAYAGGIVSEEYQQQINARARELNLEKQVRYLGIVEPGPVLNQLYNAAEATIFASQYESFGLVIIESLSAGTPVLIEQDTPFSFGDGCIPYSKDTFTDTLACTALCNSIRSGISSSARENALRHYSWRAIAKDYLAVLK